MGFENQACAHSMPILISQSQQSQRLLSTAFQAHTIKLLCQPLPKKISPKDLKSPPIIIIDTQGMPLQEAFNAIASYAKQCRQSHIVCLFNTHSITDKIGALTHGAHTIWDMAMGEDDLQHQVHLALSSIHSYTQVPKSFDKSTTNKTIADKIDTTFEAFIGQSVVMQSLYTQIDSVACSDAPVFITGESGVGKQVCAQTLHKRSKRSGGKFVALNCGAIPADLMESEIFGALAGACTGARKDRIGSAELADGGTLFLNEIGEMELGLQAKLLRFLQTGTINRVGDPHERELDVRIICATNRSPQERVKQGRFREDLFYRLYVLPLHVPCLRERGQDIAALAEHFLSVFSTQENKAFSRLSPECAQKLTEYNWPGNVRQLQNVIRRAVILHHGTQLEAHMLDFDYIDTPAPAKNIPGVITSPNNPGNQVIIPLWQQEQAIIDSAISAYDGNIAKAAKALEISPSTIYRKMENWRTKAA